VRILSIFPWKTPRNETAWTRVRSSLQTI